MVTINSEVPLSELALAWRREAELLKRWPGNDGTVIALLRAAEQLELSIELHEDEQLTLEQAAAESGYSTDHIGRLLRENPQFNCGDKYRPRVRRRDLRLLVRYKRPKQTVAVKATSGENADRLFRDIVNSKFGG